MNTFSPLVGTVLTLGTLWLTSCSGGADKDAVSPSSGVDSGVDGSGGLDTDGLASWDDVRPIIEDHCSRCHSANRLSTYRRLETHSEVTSLRANILDKLRVSPPRNLRMPVASNHTSDEGCTPSHPTVNDKRLDDDDLATLIEFLQRTDHLDYTDEYPPIVAPTVPALAGAVEQTSTQFEVLNDGFLTHPDGNSDEFMDEYGHDEREYDQMEDDWFCIQFDPSRIDPGYLTGVQVLTDSGQIYLGSQLVIDTTGASDAAKASADERGDDWYRCDAGLGFSDATPLWRTVPGGEAVTLPEATGLRFEAGWTFVLRVDFHTHYDTYEFERLEQDGVIDDDAGTMTWFNRATLRTTWATPQDITRELEWVSVEPSTQVERDSFSVARGESTLRYTATIPADADTEYAVFSAEVGMGKLGQAASLADASTSACVTSNTDFSPKWIEQAIYAEGEAPTLDASSVLDLQCTYRNETDEAVTWGAESEATAWGRKERCSAVVFYYPRS
ncbi:MAG: hypothetical protein ACI8PZ_000926 [Myxococcota bacterium]|jgi:hypothetical protein